jgi:hypothetical protein
MTMDVQLTGSEWNNDLMELEVSNGIAFWTSLSEMFQENYPSPRAYHGLVSAGKHLFVLGGAVQPFSAGKFYIL